MKPIINQLVEESVLQGPRRIIATTDVLLARTEGDPARSAVMGEKIRLREDHAAATTRYQRRINIALGRDPDRIAA